MLDASAARSALLVHLGVSPGHAKQMLEDHGFWISQCSHPEEALQRARTLQPDLVLVQLEGRQPEQWEACQRIVQACGGPTMVLLEDSSVEARLAALASGADDVLAQPIHPLELGARAKALLRRAPSRSQDTSPLHHAELELDLDGRQATLQGEPLDLTPQEFRLLAMLLQSPQRAFSREELLSRTHRFDDPLPLERSIDTHIAQLRHKLADTDEPARYIATVRGVGYRLASEAGADPRWNSASRGELEGRVALVTGGGRGIGKAIAEVLAGAGAAVAVAARTASEVEAVAAELRVRGQASQALVCDVTDVEQVNDLITATIAWRGAVDVLVCNAGSAASVPTHKMDDALWERLLAVNLSSAFYAARSVLPHMLERRWGRIIAVASTASRIGYAYSAGYCAAKHGLLGFIRALALEVAQKGITANAVCPSFTRTTLAEQAARTIAGKTGRSLDEALGMLAGMSPQQRLIEPDEVARVVLMLAGEAAHGVTGQALNVDGGTVMS